jgi:hypothetical protein
MPPRDFDLPSSIAEPLRELFKESVEAPLPPLILQLMRRLHEQTGSPDDPPSEPPRRMRADLFLPGARAQWLGDRG